MIHRFVATMRKSRSIPKYLKQCRAIIGKARNSAWLSKPPVSYAEVEQHLDDLDKAERATVGGEVGLTSDRDTKLGTVVNDMGLFIAYAEAQANSNPADGETIIEGVGLFVVKRTIPVKPELAAKHGKAPGVAKLYARAQKGRVAYHWQMGTNDTWTSLPDTVYAATSVTGLTQGVIYTFRYRTVSKEGISDWSGPVTFVAH